MRANAPTRSGRRALPSARLPADHRHRAGRPAEACIIDVVLELFAPHGDAHRPRQRLIVLTRPENRAQVRLLQREEARAQVAIGGQTDTVTVLAEWLADRI